METGSPTRRRGTFVSDVVVNRRLCAEHFLLRVRLDEFPPSQPGQFVQLQCRFLAEQVGAHGVDWPPGRLPKLTQPELAGKEPLLRRPFSLAGRADTPDGVELDIIYRTVGTGTHWLVDVGAGDALSVLGPLGKGFRIREEKPAAALVGGGVGIPPMIYLAEALAAAGKRVAAFNGVAAAELLPLTIVPTAEIRPDGLPTACVMEFARHGVDSGVTTDDGSLGREGFVHEAFAHWLDRGGARGGDLVVYACGPEAMMRAVAEICLAREIDCQLALERHMACGMGTCQSCVVKIRDDTDAGWSFKLCCTDGPVFDARQVVWE